MMNCSGFREDIHRHDEGGKEREQHAGCYRTLVIE